MELRPDGTGFSGRNQATSSRYTGPAGSHKLYDINLSKLTFTISFSLAFQQCKQLAFHQQSGQYQCYLYTKQHRYALATVRC